METIDYNGEQYVLLKKEAYNTLVYIVKGIKENPANDQVSLEEKAANILAKGGAAL